MMITTIITSLMRMTIKLRMTMMMVVVVVVMMNMKIMTEQINKNIKK